jgi:hypothetical protein
MEPLESMSETQSAEVAEDPSIALARHINSTAQQDHRVKAKEKREETQKKLLAACGGVDGR